MDLFFERNSCAQNNSDTNIKRGALAFGTPAVACLILNLVGLLSALIFVCTKKNTFFLRLYVYLSVLVTMCVCSYSLYFLLYVWPENQFLCKILHSFVEYCVAVEKLFVFSINVILIYKVSSSFRLGQHKNALAERLSGLKRNCLEVVFVVLQFGVPAVAFSTFLAIEKQPGLCFVTVRHSVDCFLGEGFVRKEYLTFEVVPLLLNSCLSALCVTLLVVWLCWLRTRFLLKTRMKKVIKEIGAWLGFLVGYCVAGWIVEVAHISNSLAIQYTEFIFLPLFQSCIPIAFFIYMCVSLCPSRKKKEEWNYNAIGSTVQTTTPPSTRVSLPTDTLAHAPNFLSPSTAEPTDVTPLLN